MKSVREYSNGCGGYNPIARAASVLLAVVITASNASAQTPYIEDCRMRGVPIPPDWAETGTPWVFQGELTENLLSPGEFAGVWTYSDPAVRGACIALPRGSGGLGTLAGFICQSATTGHACFWDNLRRGDATDTRLPWKNQTLVISQLQDGSNLSNFGRCTNCHRGDNVFLISPDDPTWAKVLKGPLSGPSTGTFTTRVEASADNQGVPPHPRYIPVTTQPPRPEWANPIPTPGCAGACHETHNVGVTSPRMPPLCASAPNGVGNCSAAQGPTPPSPAGSLHFSAATYRVTEGAGNALITVRRMGGSTGQVSVNYATGGGTATDGADYTFTQGTLTWTAGDAVNKTFSVPIIADTDVEGPETVNLILSNPGGSAVLGTPSTSTLSIVDKNGPTFKCGGRNVTSNCTVNGVAGQPCVGTVGNDVITGSSGADVIQSLLGNDTIKSLAGNDNICGGGGNDVLAGGSGNDKLFGALGNDRFNGGRNRDTCSGGPGLDRAVGCEVRSSIP